MEWLETRNILQIVGGLIILGILALMGASFQYIRIKAFSFLVGGVFWFLVLLAVFLIFVGINELRN